MVPELMDRPEDTKIIHVTALSLTNPNAVGLVIEINRHCLFGHKVCTKFQVIPGNIRNGR